MSPVRPDVTVVGRSLGGEDQRLRDFLTRAAQPFEWLEAGTAAADELLAARGILADDLPAVIDGERAIAPATIDRVAEAWGIASPPSREEYDVAIVGTGPAGLAAAVYAASDGLATLALEEDLPGGQASYTSSIENFFGFPEGIGGAELARLAGRQAEKFGAELLIRRGVVGHRNVAGGRFEIDVAGGHRIVAPLVIAAPGMVWRRLDVDGVDELLGGGVYYGAGRAEAAGCGDQDVVIVGGGNSAGQAAMHLASSGARVKVLVRGTALGSSMSAYLVERIAASPLVEVRLETRVEAVEEEGGQLSGVRVVSAGGATERLPARMMFLCLGGVPRTAWAQESGVRTDQRGYILTGPDLLEAGERPAGWPLDRDPLALETSVPGLFAAGDVRHGSTKRVGGAVGEGAMAVALAHRRLDEIRAGG
ncbi:MAG TPA: NAD(P)/FAD-dependent oxidoreductase [Solirubrobacterales bacterium]